MSGFEAYVERAWRGFARAYDAHLSVDGGAVSMRWLSRAKDELTMLSILIVQNFSITFLPCKSVFFFHICHRKAACMRLRAAVVHVVL